MRTCLSSAQKLWLLDLFLDKVPARIRTPGGLVWNVRVGLVRKAPTRIYVLKFAVSSGDLAKRACVSQEPAIQGGLKSDKLTPCRVGEADHLPQSQGGASEAGEPEESRSCGGGPRLPALHPLPDKGGNPTLFSRAFGVQPEWGP